MSRRNRTSDLEADQQGQDFFHSQPCMFYTTLPQPNVHTVVPSPGNAGQNIYFHHVSDHQDSTLTYGPTQYNGIPHQHPAASAPSNPYNPYMAAASASQDFPVPVNHGQHHVDDVRGPFKRKNAEGIPGNLQYHHGLAGPSSSVAPVIATTRESDVLMDAPSFTPPDIVSGRNHNHLLQGNYVGQAHQLPGPGNPWLDQQFNSNGSETQNWVWNQAAPLPYIPDAGNMGVHRYQITPTNGGLTSFLHPPVPQGHLSFHHLPPNIQGMRGHGITFPPQMTPSSHRHLEAGPRYIPPMPTSFGLYRPHRRDVVLERNTRLRNLPNMRVLPEDGVAMLDVPSYHEISDHADQHRDMRLDIDHMSYEELLALGEQIGTVRTGLSDEVINSCLKTRSFSSSGIPFTLESAACSDHETDFCVICQTDYKDQETMGTLDCGHEYHSECVKKWLVVKNTCPICKSAGLSMERKGLE